LKARVSLARPPGGASQFLKTLHFACIRLHRCGFHLRRDGFGVTRWRDRQTTLPFSLKGSPERLRRRVLIFSRRSAPEKTVKFSTFCKVITSCQQGTYIICNYLQLTIVRLRRSDRQFDCHRRTGFPGQFAIAGVRRRRELDIRRHLDV